MITWCHSRATWHPRAGSTVEIATKLSSHTSVNTEAPLPLRDEHIAAFRSARTSCCSPRIPSHTVRPYCTAPMSCLPTKRPRPPARGSYYSYIAADHASATACHASVSAIVAGNIAFLARYAAMVGQWGAYAIETGRDGREGSGINAYVNVEWQRLIQSLRALDRRRCSGGGGR